MLIELKKVKHARFASQETECFEAEVWIDGVMSGTVSNEGRGGPNGYRPHAVGERLEAFAKTLPRIASPYFPEGLQPDADIVIGDAFDAYQRAQAAKRTRPTHTNLFALRQLFGAADRVPNKIAKVDLPHVRRCYKAGLVDIQGTELVLTDAGKKAVRA